MREFKLQIVTPDGLVFDGAAEDFPAVTVTDRLTADGGGSDVDSEYCHADYLSNRRWKRDRDG